MDDLSFPPRPVELTRQRSISDDETKLEVDDVTDDPEYGLVFPDGPPPLSRARSRSESPPRRQSSSYAGSRTKKSSGSKKKRGESVKVFVRVRPELKKERSAGMSVVTFDSDGKGVTLTLEDGLPHAFRANSVFTPETDQADVYHYVGRPLIESILDGYNASVLAYGQTGSGKTYTMMGGGVETPSGAFYAAEDRGMIPRMVQDLFDRLSVLPKHMDHEIRCSMMEVYMEKARDLLNLTGENLKIQERYRQFVALGLAEVPVLTVRDVMLVMQQGVSARTTAATRQNDHSSRSHAIFQVKVLIKDTERGVTKTSNLYLVDLAGSEKANTSGLAAPPGRRPVKGVKPVDAATRLREGRLINQSLLQLGEVISALSRKAVHVPYRNSLLTKLLSHTFGGNSKTALIVCASPSSLNGRETLQSLRFGARASTIRNAPVANANLSTEELRRQLADCNTMVLSQLMRLRQLDDMLAAFRKAARTMTMDVDKAAMKTLFREHTVLRTLKPATGSVKSIPTYLLAHVLTYAGGIAMSIGCCVNKRWKTLLSTDKVWRLLLRLEMGDDALKEVPDGTALKDYYRDVMAKEYVKRRERMEAAREAIIGSNGPGIRLLPAMG